MEIATDMAAGLPVKGILFGSAIMVSGEVQDFINIIHIYNHNKITSSN
jgi:hypothetical protein